MSFKFSPRINRLKRPVWALMENVRRDIQYNHLKGFEPDWDELELILNKHLTDGKLFCDQRFSYMYNPSLLNYRKTRSVPKNSELASNASRDFDIKPIICEVFIACALHSLEFLTKYYRKDFLINQASLGFESIYTPKLLLNTGYHDSANFDLKLANYVYTYDLYTRRVKMLQRKYSYVLKIDIKRFFSNLPFTLVRAALLDCYGSSPEVIQLSDGVVRSLPQERGQTKGLTIESNYEHMLSGIVLRFMMKDFTNLEFAAYVDDFAFFSEDPTDLSYLLIKFKKHIGKYGFEVNDAKTALLATRDSHSKKLVRLCEMTYIDKLEYGMFSYLDEINSFRKYLKHHSIKKILARFEELPVRIKRKCRVLVEYRIFKEIYENGLEASSEWIAISARINARGTPLERYNIDWLNQRSPIDFQSFSSFAEMMNSTYKTSRVYFKYHDLKYLLVNRTELLNNALSVTSVSQVTEFNILNVLREYHYKIRFADIDLLFDILEKFPAKTKWIVYLLSRVKDIQLHKDRLTVALENEYFKYRWERSKC